MHTTEPFTPTASGPRTRGDVLADVLPVIGTVYVAGPPVFLAWVGIVLFALMLAGPFALLVTLVVAVAAAAALVTRAGAFVGSPYLLIRHFRRRLAKRRHLAEVAAPITTVMARTAMATQRPGIAALAESTTARTS